MADNNQMPASMARGLSFLTDSAPSFPEEKAGSSGYHPQKVVEWGESHGLYANTEDRRKELTEAYVAERKAPSGMAASTIAWHLGHYVKGERVGMYNPDGTTTAEAPKPQVYRAEWSTWADAEKFHTIRHKRRGMSAEEVKALRSTTPGVVFDVDRGEICNPPALRHGRNEPGCICETDD